MSFKLFLCRQIFKIKPEPRLYSLLPSCWCCLTACTFTHKHPFQTTARETFRQFWRPTVALVPPFRFRLAALCSLHRLLLARCHAALPSFAWTHTHARTHTVPAEAECGRRLAGISLLLVVMSWLVAGCCGLVLINMSGKVKLLIGLTHHRSPIIDH